MVLSGDNLVVLSSTTPAPCPGNVAIPCHRPVSPSRSSSPSPSTTFDQTGSRVNRKMSRISSCRGVLTPWCPDVGARAMVIYSISGRPRKLATMAMGVVYSSRDGRSTWHCRIKKCRRDACGVGIQLQTCGDVILVNDSLGWRYLGMFLPQT